MIKKLLFTLFLALCTSFLWAQSYIGRTTGNVNFRTEPSTTSEIIKQITKGSQIFIISPTTIDGFYNVIDIETDQEGYLHSSFVSLEQRIEESEGGVFEPTGRIQAVNPELKIFNNTSLTLTLKLGETKYFFKPQERKTITATPGKWYYRASAPGVIPDTGSDYFESNNAYQWEFYIVTGVR
jgi:hypothetical protein